TTSSPNYGGMLYIIPKLLGNVISWGGEHVLETKADMLPVTSSVVKWNDRQPSDVLG
ncbi:hypothetical protein J6590_107047, partial [Homalodisca vitripennis]